MIINSAEKCDFREETRLQSIIEFSDGTKKLLWYAVPKNFGSYLTNEKLDGFLVGLLPLAMQNRENIEVRGSISEKLFFNLLNSYMEILCLVNPSFSKVKITPQDFDNGSKSKTKGFVATGFSAGVDSFCTINDHFFNEKLPDYRVTHFIFNNVGAHHDFDHKKGRAIFHARHKLLSGYPESLGIDFLKIDSNLAEFYRSPFDRTHISRNISAVLMLQKLFSKFYYSSGYKYEDCTIMPNNDICRAEPMVVHLLSTETTECISVGCEYSRVEKTLRMAKVPNSNKWLNVCFSPDPLDGKNCSICPKCCRTLLTLEILGIIDDFNQVFDLDKWKKVRKAYIINGLGSFKKDPFMCEIQDYATTVGYTFDGSLFFASKWVFLSDFVNSRYRYFPKPLKTAIKILKKRLSRTL